VGFLKKATNELGSGVVKSSDPVRILTRSKSRVSSVHHQKGRRQEAEGFYVYFV
jgi:hypothetical protein